MHVSGHDLFQALVKVSFRSEPSEQRGPKTVEAPSAATKAREMAVEASAKEQDDAAAALRYQRSEKTTLKLRTQEGDVVRIKIQNRTSAQATLSGAEDAAGGAGEMELSAEISSKLRIKVKGHLNADELLAIQDAVAQAADIADQFFTNDVEGAFATASAFKLDSEQLAGVKFRFRMRESAIYSALGPAAKPEPLAPGPVDGGPSAESSKPAEAPVLVSKSGPSEAPLETPAAQAPLGADAVAGVTDPVVDEADAPPAGAETGGAIADPQAMAEALRAIGDFLAQILEKLGHQGEERPAARLDVSLKIQVVRTTIEALAESREETEEPMPALVGDTLEALAAEQQTPLNEVA